MTEQTNPATSPSTLTPEQARRAVADAILRIVPDADLEAAGDDAPLRSEFELDSLDFLSFVELVSTATGVRIDEDDYASLTTVATSVRFLVDRAKGAA
jgi:acyl carrier protein